MQNIRSTSVEPEGRRLDPPSSWCVHPEEELQAVFAGGTQRIAGRKLCGLCGQLILFAIGDSAR